MEPIIDNQPEKTPAKKPHWLSPQGLSGWTVAAMILLTLSLIPLTKTDAPVRAWILAAAFLEGLGAYFYTHSQRDGK